MYKESTNVVVKHLVNRLRDVRTASNEFRLTIEEISCKQIKRCKNCFK